MGIASLGGLLSGAGDVQNPSTGQSGADFAALLGQYLNAQPQVWQNEQQYKPQYAQLMSGLWNSNFNGALPTTTSTAFGSLMGLNPGATNLLTQLTNSAQQQLGAGASLDPALAQVTTQALRGSQAARGLGMGPSDALMESTALTQLGNQLRQQRQQFASGVQGLNTSYYLPLLQQSLGIGSQAAGGAASAAVGAGPSLTPTNNLFSLLTMPYQAQLQKNLTSAGLNTGLYQSMDANQTKMFGSTLGAVTGG